MTFRLKAVMPLFALFFIILFISPVHAIDPRFELDQEILQRNLPGTPAPTKTPPASIPDKGSKVKKNVDSRDKSIARDEMGKAAQLPGVRRRRGSYAGARSKRTNAVTRRGEGAKRSLHDRRNGAITASKPSGSENISHRLSLFKAVHVSSGEAVSGARNVWSRLIPGASKSIEPYSVEGKSFSLSLDPKRFPVFPTAKGGKVVVEAGGTLTPLVRALIEQHEPGVRFIRYRPEDRKSFFSDLLDAAGFYSVEKDFSVSFGTDPKLTVTSDFKVENNSDSAFQNDIFLLNESSRSGFPQALTEYMAGQGFKTIDIYPTGREEKLPGTNVIGIITENDPAALTDTLLSYLNQRYEKNRDVDILSMGDGGVGLKVRADRYFVRNGEKYVVGMFRGDPESYTLLRILDSMQYHVVMIEPEDDFRTVCSKLLSQLRLSDTYEMHDMLPDGDRPYSISMSGIVVKSPNSAGRLFLTGTRPDPVISRLLQLNGYTIRDGSEEVVRK